MFYEIRVTNNGATPYEQVRVTATVPDGMVPDPLGTVGPTEATKPHPDGQVIRFDPLPDLRPGESMVYSVHVRAKQPGTWTFRAEVSATGLSQPLQKEASTEVL